ncbi:hypothetical protein PR002_g30129 [Phytophthora rubi]|uniref:Cation/H+ exchanger transmembrane domain-containing protein n=1 Tax=Phytophthora rubi TaxID=129364 RepID=A0A6A3GUX1_9STRA|nr:hypothetical protein PR002_g30129 [Phytophthora rubi]
MSTGVDEYVLWKKVTPQRSADGQSQTDAVGSGSAVADFARASAGGSRCPPSRRRCRQVVSDCLDHVSSAARLPGQFDFPRFPSMGCRCFRTWLPLAASAAAALAPANASSSFDSLLQSTRLLADADHTVPFNSWSDVPDTLSHLLAFVLVLLGAHPLGLFYPKYFRLPLITGYLVAGILSGPFLANLLNEDVVDILGSYVNAFALSFISFQAGQEIYLPELRPQIKSILALGTTVFKLAAGASFYSGLVHSCQLGIVLMFASISVFVSPSTVMALKIELNSVGPFTHVALGTCMTAEFVVLVSFSVSRVVASIYCAKLAREHRLHHGRRAHEPRARSAAPTRDDPHVPAAKRPA